MSGEVRLGPGGSSLANELKKLSCPRCGKCEGVGNIGRIIVANPPKYYQKECESKLRGAITTLSTPDQESPS